MREGKTSYMKVFWRLILPYWKSEEWFVACGLLFVIVVLNVGLVYLTVLFNEWNRFFYDALQNLDYGKFKTQLLRFTVLAFIYIAIAVYRLYLSQMLEMKWRRWLTEKYIGDWLKDRSYYLMSLGAYAADNPDQRIAEDFRLFTSGALSLSLGLLSATTSIILFVTILWSLSGSIDFTVGGYAMTIPGYLVWVAIIYAAAGSACAHFIGRKLIDLNFRQQKFEADFRFGLVRVRENAEGVALYDGEDVEKGTLQMRFARILQNWWQIMKKQKQLSWFTASYTQVAIIFPFVVSAPQYFSKAIQLGGLMQIVSAFSNVQSNLSWFVDNYRSFADWRASADRLVGFHTALIDAAAMRENAELQYEESVDDGRPLQVRDVFIGLPGGGSVQRDLSVEVRRGERLMLRGPSGCGKSTFFRTIAGIWPFAKGQISAPGRSSRLFLPQKPYIPISTLKDAVIYPGLSDGISDEDVKVVLSKCGLDNLLNRLNEVAHWEHVLSPGEQQRLAFARVLLHKPDWVFLDEATSAIDDAMQERLYGLLLNELPGSSVVSIAHRPGVERFHQREFAMTGAD